MNALKCNLFDKTKYTFIFEIPVCLFVFRLTMSVGIRFMLFGGCG